jgi:hypothetical protein
MKYPESQDEILNVRSFCADAELACAFQLLLNSCLGTLANLEMTVPTSVLLCVAV